MFQTSAGLCVGYLLVTLLLPWLAGILSIQLLTGTRFRGRLLHLLSWFAGVGVVGYGIFLLQFLRYGVDIISYIVLIAVLVIALLIRAHFSGWKCKHLLEARKIESPWGEFLHTRKKNSTPSKVITVILGLFVLTFIVTSFVFVTHFPSYGDDAFGNRHMPVINIVYDGGVKIFGEAGEILARGRLGYPIMIPTFQALIAKIMGGYNDIYINLFHWVGLMLFIGICKVVTYEKTKNLLLTSAAPVLIISLPLIFLHTTQGYMDLLSAIYTALAVMSLYAWLDDNGTSADLLTGVLFLGILSYVKNDGFVVYMAGILIALVIYFLIFRRGASQKLRMLKKPVVWIPILIILLFFIAPFTFLKSYYHLGFNQAAGADAGLGLASSIHWEIFPALRNTIWALNNFSVAWVVLVLLAAACIARRKHIDKPLWFLLIAPAVIGLIFIAVFLFTENYQFVLNQTTSNRVFTMMFVIVFSYCGLLLNALPVKKYLD